MIRSTQSIVYTKRVDGRSVPVLRGIFVPIGGSISSPTAHSSRYSRSPQRETILCSLLYCRPALSWRWFSHVGFTVLQARCAEQKGCTMMNILAHCCGFHCGYMLQVVLRVVCFQHDLSWLAGTLWYGPSWTPRVNRPIYSYGCGTLLPHVRLLAHLEVHKRP